MFALLPLELLCALPLIFLVFRTFDELLFHQRTSHAQAWEADGRPHPYLFRAGLDWPRTYQSQFAGRRLSMVWVFRTPGWASGDARARRLLRRLRILFFVWNLGVMPIYIGTLFLAARAAQRAHQISPHSTDSQQGR